MFGNEFGSELIDSFRDYRKRKVKQFKTYILTDGILYKIGKSTNIKRRFETIQGSNPSIKLIFMCDYDFEHQLHERFKAKKVKGEWFDLSISDIEAIKFEFDYLKAGSFPNKKNLIKKLHDEKL
jgi:hypothetical protein